MARLYFVRVLPLVLVLIAVAVWFNDVQEGGPYVWRNLVPLGLLLVFAVVTLHRGEGTWTGSGWCWLLGTLGYTIPALGLSVYLHYAFLVNLNDLFAEAVRPEQLFRFLPMYTTGAGGIGFAIGWIVGRNI